MSAYSSRGGASRSGEAKRIAAKAPPARVETANSSTATKKRDRVWLTQFLLTVAIVARLFPKPSATILETTSGVESFTEYANMFGPIGMPELILIFLVALLVFGPRKLPELGKSLGRGLAEFKRASDDLKRTIEDEIEQGKHQVAGVRDEVSAIRDQARELRDTVASTASPVAAPPAPEPRTGPEEAEPPSAPIQPS
jgi:sec-independent protein translocase protein TatA